MRRRWLLAEKSGTTPLALWSSSRGSSHRRSSVQEEPQGIETTIEPGGYLLNRECPSTRGAHFDIELMISRWSGLWNSSCFC